MPLYNSAPINLSWKLTFDDEFNSLNTGTWGTNWLGNPGTITKPINSAEQAAYDPAQVSVSGGYLRLGTAYKDVTVAGTHYDMVAGIVQSDNRFEQTYGYFEARIYLPGSNGQIQNWPAFWLNGENWPTDGELDIMEGLSGKAGWHFHSPSGGPGETEAGNYTGWHTYGALWEPGKVTYYYDGVEVGEISTGITSSPMYLILTMASRICSAGLLPWAALCWSIGSMCTPDPRPLWRWRRRPTTPVPAGAVRPRRHLPTTKSWEPRWPICSLAMGRPTSFTLMREMTRSMVLEGRTRCMGALETTFSMSTISPTWSVSWELAPIPCVAPFPLT